METLLPNVSRHPYYISAPPYVQSSAGIRVMHLLCHWLNRKGERAFIAPSSYAPKLINPDLLTPLLQPEIVSHHSEQGVVPIVLYPETETGNRMNAECVVRYVLNTPGHLAGDTTYGPLDMVWAYSEHLQTQCARCDGVLHMPVVDQNMFKPNPNVERKGSVFYAAKYRQVHHQEVFGLPEDAIEITRDLPGSQTPPEIAQLLQTAETFYCFENSAMAIEAVLCGTPAVFMPNPYLDKPIALAELGWDGYAWGADPEEIERARATVEQGQENYSRLVDTFLTQLDAYIAGTQKTAQECADARAKRRVQSNTVSDFAFDLSVPVPEVESATPAVTFDNNAMFNSRQIADGIRGKRKWRFNEWFRIVRALNVIAVRSILQAGGLRRYGQASRTEDDNRGEGNG
jgi:hypothetical protein